MVPKLRVARATNDIGKLLPFYRDGLGLEVLTEFREHEGFDGIMLGKAGAPYHLEFTVETGHSVPRAPTKENLLCFYLPDKTAWDAAVGRMAQAGIAPVAAHNPYWDRCGKTYEDADGYRVVLVNSAWNL